MNKDKYHAYLNSPQWQVKRQLALNEAHHRCFRCGATSTLQVHHLTYARLGNELLSDLRVLCDACHRFIHGIPVSESILPRKPFKMGLTGILAKFIVNKTRN